MFKTLIDPSTLAAKLADPDWIVIDCRFDLTDPAKGEELYREAHIPGAKYAHLDRHLSGTKTGKNGRHPLPEIDVFAEKMRRCGVTARSQVVIYDDMGGNWAMRLWWLLRWLGHDAVAVLDGQFPLWVKEGRPVTKEVPAPRKGAFVPRPHLGDEVDVHFVERFSESPEVKLVDERVAERFSGKQETIDPVAGHVRGEINRFWKDNLGADGRFKAASQLREEFDRLLEGAQPEQVVHMCGSGVTACHNIFAMELAGLPGSKLYAGSWSEWCADPARRVATGGA